MSEQDIAYGGQAVIGGVMIQSPKGWSLGIRDKNNKLHKYYEERVPLIKRNKFWSAPLIPSVAVSPLSKAYAASLSAV